MSAFIFALKKGKKYTDLIKEWNSTLEEFGEEDIAEESVAKTKKKFKEILDYYTGGGPLDGKPELKEEIAQAGIVFIDNGFIIYFKEDDGYSDELDEEMWQTHVDDPDNIKLLYSSLDYGF